MNALSFAKTLRLGPPASGDSIREAEMTLGVRFPFDYVEFLAASNGAEGPIGQSNYLVIWPIERVAPLNDAYAVREFAPRLILVGTDGGDTGYGFAREANGRSLVRAVEVPLLGLSDAAAIDRGVGLTSLLRVLAGDH